MILLGLMAVVALASYVMRQREPSYQDRPLSYWALTYVESHWNGHNPLKAEAAIRAVGPRSIPVFLRWIRSAQSSDEQSMARARAASICLRLYRDSGPHLVRDLVEILNDSKKPEAQRFAVYSLVTLGESALLAAHLGRTNAPMRAEVAMRMGSFAFNDRDIEALLRRCLEDHDSEVRQAASSALQAMQEYRPVEIEMICNDIYPLPARLTAIQNARTISTRTNTLIAALLQATSDADETIRIAATNALMRIAPEALTNATPTVDLAAQARICFRNLRAMDAAKHQWALVKDQPDAATPSVAALLEYLGATNLPVCPGGGTYQLLPVDQFPRCSITSHNDNPF